MTRLDVEGKKKKKKKRVWMCLGQRASSDGAPPRRTPSPDCLLNLAPHCFRQLHTNKFVHSSRVWLDSVSHNSLVPGLVICRVREDDDADAVPSRFCDDRVERSRRLLIVRNVQENV